MARGRQTQAWGLHVAGERQPQAGRGSAAVCVCVTEAEHGAGHPPRQVAAVQQAERLPSMLGVTVHAVQAPQASWTCGHGLAGLVINLALGFVSGLGQSELLKQPDRFSLPSSL